MSEVKRYDTVIVGARAAGASLAIELRRLGQTVAVVDRATFPSDVMSTHVVYPNTLRRFERLGVLPAILDNGPPPLYTSWIHENRMFVAPHTPVDDRDWAICIRRITLDEIMVNKAREEGAEIYEGWNVSELIGVGTEEDPVKGVIANKADQCIRFEADLVAGADGVNSTVATRVSSQKHKVMPTDTMLYFAYWKGVATRNTQDFFFEPPWIHAHFPADNGYHVITMNGPVSERKKIKNMEAFYLDRLRSIPALWSRLEKAEKVSRVLGTPKLEGYYRDSAGPGWLLVGDASHFKHPAGAQGIGDALHASEAVAPMIIDGSYRSEYPKWRESVSRELYAFCKHLSEVPSDEGMRRVIDAAIADPVLARKLVDVWCRTSSPWNDVIPRAPFLADIMGESVEAVLAPLEAVDKLPRLAQA
ncbi:MAG: NAD(P)/FAD-dependent oxidoreductase [Gammaproteobacteria bacterium]|nr:NAD(P)/FAD-dependent oxidoreductase [Gammaproteobacteria bacterium]